jgi:predicted dehydrogenase
MNSLRIAVIGVGYLGKFHAQKLAQMPNVSLVGIADLDIEKAKALAAEHHCEAVADYHELLPKIDAAVIVVPTRFHFDVAMTCLQKNLHVFIEKPITTTVEEADILIKTAKEKNCLIQVGHLERFNPAIIGILPFLNNPLFIESHRIAPFTPRGTDVNVILDLMIHDIDLICHLVKSKISDIRASGSPILSNEIDIANARIEFENGCVANVTASRAGTKTERSMRLFQADGYFSINLHEKTASIYRKGDGEIFPGIPNIQKESVSFDKGDAIYAELSEFTSAIREHRSPAVTGIDGCYALDIAEKITKILEK